MNEKKLKFLVDVGVSNMAEKWLSENGYDIKTIRDIDPRMSDVDILNLASSENRMVITMDKDFGELIYHSRSCHSGVLLLRLDNANGEEKVNVIKTILLKYSDKIENHFCVFQNGRLRIRRL